MLQKGIDILDCDSGAFARTLMSQGFLSLGQVKYFVLDEADRMLDMGFIHDIKRILPKLPKEKTDLVFFGDDARFDCYAGFCFIEKSCENHHYS